MKPIGNIRVPHLTGVVATPYWTALLAELGAEIIKIEPERGDDFRSIASVKDGAIATFSLNNRSKKSRVLDLKSEQGSAPAHLMALEVGRQRPLGFRFSEAAAMAKLMASKVVDTVADTVLQIHGCYDDTRDFPNKRVIRIYKGLSEIQRNHVAGHLLAH